MNTTEAISYVCLLIHCWFFKLYAIQCMQSEWESMLVLSDLSRPFSLICHHTCMTTWLQFLTNSGPHLTIQCRDLWTNFDIICVKMNLASALQVHRDRCHPVALCPTSAWQPTSAWRRCSKGLKRSSWAHPVLPSRAQEQCAAAERSWPVLSLSLTRGWTAAAKILKRCPCPEMVNQGEVSKVPYDFSNCWEPKCCIYSMNASSRMCSVSYRPVIRVVFCRFRAVDNISISSMDSMDTTLSAWSMHNPDRFGSWQETDIQYFAHKLCFSIYNFF